MKKWAEQVWRGVAPGTRISVVLLAIAFIGVVLYTVCCTWETRPGRPHTATNVVTLARPVAAAAPTTQTVVCTALPVPPASNLPPVAVQELVMISGCVLRARDGMPVAAVAVRHRAAGGSSETSTVTDRHGRFALHGTLADDGDAGTVLINDPFYAAAVRRLGYDYVGQELLIHLYDPAVIYGTVTDPAGVPISNATVHASEYGDYIVDVRERASVVSANECGACHYERQGDLSARTDAQGLYALSNVLAPGNYRLSGAHAELQSPCYDGNCTESVVVTPCGSHRCDLVLYPRSARSSLPVCRPRMAKPSSLSAARRRPMCCAARMTCRGA